MKNNNIIILGAGGMLGKELTELLKTAFTVHPYSRTDIDITSATELEDAVKRHSPGWIINCAAFTKVDLCETEPGLAMQINAYALESLAQIAKRADSRIIHFSTDYVFDGENPDGYDEYGSKKPLNIYGASKSLGEDFLTKLSPEHSYIIRTAWLYGKYGKNFVTTMLDMALKQDTIKVVDDQIGSPTYTLDLAQSIQDLIENERAPGIYHLANSGQASWFEFARTIFTLNAKKAGGTTPVVVPIKSTELQRPARRPAYSILQNTKLPPLRPWAEALNYFINHDL